MKGMKEVKLGADVKEGDIVKHTMHVEVGTRRVRQGRSYNDYAVYADKEVTGVVEMGTYAVAISTKKIRCLVVKTEENVSYDSYFMGSGKASDVPRKITNNLSEPLYQDKKYTVLGNLYDSTESTQAKPEAEPGVTGGTHD